MGEARWTYAVSKVESTLRTPTTTSSTADGLRPAVQCRHGPARSAARDPRLHRDGPRGQRPRDPRRRLRYPAWCYVDDMVDGLDAASSSGSRPWDMCSTSARPLGRDRFDLAVRIRRLMEADVDVTIAAALHRRRDADPNIDKARKLLGWSRRSTSTRDSPHHRVASRAPAGAGVIVSPGRDLGPEELAAVEEVFRSGELTMGPASRSSEARSPPAREVEHVIVVGTRHCISRRWRWGSGRARGDRPAYTFPATANVVALVGARRS